MKFSCRFSSAPDLPILPLSSHLKCGELVVLGGSRVWLRTRGPTRSYPLSLLELSHFSTPFPRLFVQIFRYRLPLPEEEATRNKGHRY